MVFPFFNVSRKEEGTNVDDGETHYIYISFYKMNVSLDSLSCTHMTLTTVDCSIGRDFFYI